MLISADKKRDYALGMNLADTQRGEMLSCMEAE